jgi:predicted transcriptional regulator
MTIKGDVLALLESFPEDLLSVREIAEQLNLKYRQVSRALQTLLYEGVIMSVPFFLGGYGSTSGKMKYYGVRVSADTEKVH